MFYYGIDTIMRPECNSFVVDPFSRLKPCFIEQNPEPKLCPFQLQLLLGRSSALLQECSAGSLFRVEGDSSAAVMQD